MPFGYITSNWLNAAIASENRFAFAELYAAVYASCSALPLARQSGPVVVGPVVGPAPLGPGPPPDDVGPADAATGASLQRRQATVEVQVLLFLLRLQLFDLVALFLDDAAQFRHVVLDLLELLEHRTRARRMRQTR